MSQPNDAQQRTTISALVEGRLAFEEKLGPLKTRITNQNRVIGALLLITILLAAALLFNRIKPTVVPYVAAIDSKSARLLFAATAQPASDLDKNAIEQQLLMRWLIDAKTVLADWEAQRLILHRVWEETDGAGRGQLETYYHDHPPDERAKTENVTVQIRNFLSQGSHTYRIDWSETAYDNSGTQAGMQMYTGQFTVALRPITTLDPSTLNPIGFKVIEIHWSQQIR